MGRNDIGSMGPVLFFKKVNITILIFFISFAGFNIYSLSAQTKGEDTKKKKEKALEYRLQANFPLKMYFNYKLTESTKVWRQFSDSSVIEYEREVTYYFTHFAPNPPDDGFQQVRVIFDSLRYKFKEGDAVFEFDSQAEELPASSFIDLTATTVPMGRSFEMFYSPYGDVAKIEGKDIDWLLNFLRESAGAFPDTVSAYIWYHGISDPHLQNIADIQKGSLPSGFIAEDSTWESRFNIELDGIKFRDTLKSEIIENKAGFITVKGEIDSLMPLPEQYRLYGIKNSLVNIDAGRGKGSYMIELTPRRAINLAKAEFYAEVVARVKRSKFKQKIHTKMTWELINQFKFK